MLEADQSRQILIVGASVRAAAISAIRAGLSPICVDLFADEDLRAIAQTTLVSERYPHDLPAIARTLPECSWMYTGALENYPDIVEEISREHLLLGNDPDVLKLVRDPFFVQRTLCAENLPALELRRFEERPTADGNWMLKPYHSAAGTGIHVWNRDTADVIQPTTDHYFQKRCEGTSISALFLAAADKTWLIGVTRQLVGLKTLHAPDFAYCGSIGPIELEPDTLDQVRRIGEVLSRRCKLQGLFGCDFFCNDKTVWLTEVNPRYPASAQIHEHAHNIPLVAWHCHACASFESELDFDGCDDQLVQQIDQCLQNSSKQIVGKMILYSPRDIIVPSLATFDERNQIESVPYIADIPTAGTAIRKGHPICTVLAVSSNFDECLAKLTERSRDVATEIMEANVSFKT